jgi:hypothetical protein
MTAHRDLKKLIRERRAKTGESYTAARAHVMREREALNGTVDFDMVLQLGALLPGVKASSSKQGVALRLKGQLVACTAINRSAQPNSLMVCLDFPVRDTLIEMRPETYYMTSHYRRYATVLVRLAKSRRSELRKLLQQAAHFVGTQGTKKTATKTAEKASRRAAAS